MAKAAKHVPLTPEEVEALTTTQHGHRARANSAYWQRRAEKVLKNPDPTAAQLERLAWFEQHSLVWLALAEKLDRLEVLEAAERRRNYDPR